VSVLVNGYHDSTNVNADQRYRTIQRAVVHPFYAKDTFYNDLMLLKLSEPVNDIPLVELNRYSDMPMENDRVTVMGLGALEFGGGYPDVLQAVEVGVIDHTICNNAYERVGLWPILNSTMVCAGYRIGRASDACQGDSGGPLINGDGVQVGVVSFGLGCAMVEFPGMWFGRH
jgi:secreted trypsin-like serine protease